MKKTLSMLGLVLALGATASGGFEAWHNADTWNEVADAALSPQNSHRLVGRPGTGALVNGEEGKCPSLVTKRRDYRDVEVHLEFMVAKGSNSGVIFHGNHEIQILDSYGVKQPNAGHCGGVYPRAESKPTYHHIDRGSPPRVNAAKRPGQWQTMDTVFQAARFDENGNKTAHARFVKVVHNGIVIQEDVEVPYACGPNWDRQQYPQGPIIIQGDYGPIAVRNLRIRQWQADTGNMLNIPPEGFTAIFNGRDFSAFRMHPKVETMWTIEDGVLKSHGLLKEWGADLATKKMYKDFVLLVDFRMPTDSDSGIHFRKLIPDMGYFGQTEQMNLGTGHRMGQLESVGFIRANKPEAAKRLRHSDIPRIKQVDPEIGQWHTLKITMIGKTLLAELDGQVMIDRYVYPEWLLSTEAEQLRFQKHRFLQNKRTGERNPCPIEFRNIFIKETKLRALNVPPEGFTALFNGKDFTGWHTPPLVKEYWVIEDGILKSPGLIESWGASLSTRKQYRDFILMLDFRMPTISDSGINFRRLIPHIPGFGDMEQFNLRSRGGMGHLESYYFLPEETARRMGLKQEEKPHVRHIDPEVGVWHTVKLTVQGRTFSAEYDGELIHDRFQYHDWMLNMEPAPIRLQKHKVVYGENLGGVNPCPIEYRNIFIKELEPGITDMHTQPRVRMPINRESLNSPYAELLTRIGRNELPEGYHYSTHQEYVDRRMAGLSDNQRARIGQLWKEKERIDPDMPNRGASFVKILAYVAENEE